MGGIRFHVAVNRSNAVNPHNADFPLTNLDSDQMLSGILAIYPRMRIRETLGHPEVISLALTPPSVHGLESRQYT